MKYSLKKVLLNENEYEYMPGSPMATIIYDKEIEIFKKNIENLFKEEYSFPVSIVDNDTFAGISTIKLNFKQLTEFSWFLIKEEIDDFKESLDSELEDYSEYKPYKPSSDTKPEQDVFDLPATNTNNARDNLKNCDELAKFLYPGYVKQTYKDLKGAEKKAGRVISRPPLVSVKYANLIKSSSS